MRFMLRDAVAVVLVVAGLGTLAACSGGTAADASISVDELVSRSADTPVSVTGLLYDDSSGTRLCGAVMESFPVQCGGPSVDLVGLDMTTVSGTTSDQGITWKEAVVLTVQRTGSGSFTVLSSEDSPEY
ncbi:hypothetical protein [Cryobacterium melibiosiphilum]|nr:hypothetical protein [Cryobacterium melibiosiphilum]